LLAAHRSTRQLLEQAQACRPRWVVVVDPAAAAEIGAGALPEGTSLAVGPEALDDLVRSPEVDRVVSAIVGAAGLQSTWAALEAGIRRFDASVGGIGGCPFAPGAAGNVATEDLVLMAERSGFATGISTDGLLDAISFAETQLQRPLGGRSGAWLRRQRAVALATETA
jgi:hypothetical protein